MSVVLFIVGLLAFAAGSAVVLGGGSLCGSGDAATSVAKTLGAPCGGVSRVAGLLILVTAAALLWGSTRLQRQTPSR